jgi:hypothetical protein
MLCCVTAINADKSELASPGQREDILWPQEHRVTGQEANRALIGCEALDVLCEYAIRLLPRSRTINVKVLIVEDVGGNSHLVFFDSREEREEKQAVKDPDLKGIAADAVLAVILTNEFQRIHDLVTQPAVDVGKYVLTEIRHSRNAGHSFPQNLPQTANRVCCNGLEFVLRDIGAVAANLTIAISPSHQYW